MSVQQYGVAPELVKTGDGDYTIPTGYTCIGFYVEGTAGDVAVTNALGSITLSGVPTYTDRIGHITSFVATGTTAVGIVAYLIK